MRPVPLDPIEDEVLTLEEGIRRKRTPLVPDTPSDPWIVPKNLWQKVQSQDIQRRASSMSILHDAQDIAFNARVQGDTESAMGQFNRPVREPVKGIAQQSMLLGLIDSRVNDALHQMRPVSALGQMSPGVAPVFDPVVEGRARFGMAPPAPLTPTQSRSARLLGAVAEATGKAFDGHAFVRELTINTVLAADRISSAAGGRSVFGGDRDAIEARFEQTYRELPRPAQLVIDELSPANIGLAVAGGPIAKLLAGAPLPGARLLAGVFKPLSTGVTAFPRAVGANALGRVGYEYTEGAPLPVRLAAGAAGILLGSNPEAILSPSWKYANGVWRGMAESSPLPAGEMAMHSGIPLRFSTGNVTSAAAGAAGGATQGDSLEERTRNAAIGAGIGFAGGSALFRGAKRSMLQPPDVIPLHIPPESRGFAFSTNTTPGARFARQDAADYAADLAQQTGERLPDAVAYDLQRARAAIRPGQTIENFIGELPGHLGDVYAKFFNPSQSMPMNIRQAFWASGAAMRQTATRLAPSRRHYLDALQDAFGGLDDIDPARIQYIGPAERKMFFRAGDSTLAEGVRNAHPNGVSVAASEHPLTNKLVDIMENPYLYDLTDAQRSLIGQFDYRNSVASQTLRDEYGVTIGEFGATEAERLGYTFGARPAAERTRAFVPIVDKNGVAVHSLNPRERLASVSGRAKERTFGSITERLESAEFGPNFQPETNVATLFDGLDEAKALAAGNEVLRWGVGGQATRDATAFFEVPEFGVFVPQAHADALQYLAKDTHNNLRNVMDHWRQVRLNGDASPLTIQGVLSWAAHPIDTTKQIISGLARGEFNLSDIASASRMNERIAADPESWLDFAFHMNLNVAKGTPAEFSAGWLEKIPVIGKRLIGPLNEDMFNLVQLGMKRHFDELSAMMIREGSDPEFAKAAAADTVRKIVPIVDNEKLAFSPSRAKWERGLATSVSFIRQPIAHVAEAATGIAKLGAQAGTVGHAGQWASLTANERMAVQTFLTMQGTITGLSVLSAINSADGRNLSPWEAAQRALDPSGGDFQRLWLSDSFSIPIGGPYRALARAIAPRDGLPFAGVPGYVRSKFTPALGAAEGLVTNSDYYGNPTRDGDFPMNVLHGIGFLASQAVPASIGSGIEAARAGVSFAEGARQVVSGFAGQSGNDISPREGIEVARRGGINALLEAPTEDNLVAAGLTTQQAAAAVGATSLEGLREAIGTRAANALADRVSADSPAAVEQYRADLQRRAERGDKNAEALLVEFTLQDRLALTAEGAMRGGGIVDRVAYREQRADLMAQSLGQSEAYREIFEGFRKSENEIDQLSAQWYDLFDRAKKPNGIVDFKVFGALEEQFYSGLGAEKAALVQGNVETAPRGANPLEVELRQTRMDLESSGFFKVDDALWEKVRNGASAELKARVASFETFDEYRASAAEQIAQKLIANGWRPAEALRFADVHSNYDPIVAAFDEAAQIEKAKWAQGNEDAARKAIEWGYLSPSILNIAASREQAQPAATPVAGTQATPELQTMAEAFLAGSSYGQLGIRFDKSAGAVEQALRRYFGGSPDEARKKAQQP